jgi:membrane associated rhomboid family serine protease
MGIYDREYYRGETGGSAWFSGVSPVCKSIIGINVAVFLLDQLINRGTNDPFIREYLAASPDGTFHHLRIWELLTATFLHAGIWHLLGNMLFLWIYGDNVEDAMGHARFLAFYLLCGAAAIFVQAMANPDSPYPIIGASGAISGVLGAYLLLFPRARVLTLVLLPFFFTTLRMPVMLLLLLWFAVQLISDLAVSDGGASVAFRAHIGGFLTGMLLVPVFKRRGVRLFAS